uniref:Putative secreted protein n=1 Tax=Ixodes ricinus TaxID=34613 RepID=A0A6B0UJG5_IXORI
MHSDSGLSLLLLVRGFCCWAGAVSSIARSFSSSTLTLSSRRCSLTTHNTVTVTRPAMRNHCTARAATLDARLHAEYDDCGGNGGGDMSRPKCTVDLAVQDDLGDVFDDAS